MNEPYFQQLFAERIGGKDYGKSTEIYKFEKIKRAKRKALADFPDRHLLDFGIGENDSLVREKVCQGLEECMGLSVDYEANRNCHGEELVISKEDSKVDVVVCPTNEELVIARDTVRILGL